MMQGTVDTTGFVIALALSATLVDATPFSTVGALAVANAGEQERKHVYRGMLAWGAAMVIIAPLFTWLVRRPAWVRAAVSAPEPPTTGILRVSGQPRFRRAPARRPLGEQLVAREHQHTDARARGVDEVVRLQLERDRVRVPVMTGTVRSIDSLVSGSAHRDDERRPGGGDQNQHRADDRGGRIERPGAGAPAGMPLTCTAAASGSVRYTRRCGDVAAAARVSAAIAALSVKDSLVSEVRDGRWRTKTTGAFRRPGGERQRGIRRRARHGPVPVSPPRWRDLRARSRLAARPSSRSARRTGSASRSIHLVAPRVLPRLVGAIALDLPGATRSWPEPCVLLVPATTWRRRSGFVLKSSRPC